MLINPRLVDKIKDYFDLNKYETKVWLSLLSKGIASAGEIAKLSRVPRSRTYDVLESLEKKGFAIKKLGKPIMYIGVKPRRILERLKVDVKKDAQEKINYLSNMKGTKEFILLEELYKKGSEPLKKEELPLSLKGKVVISNYIKEILNKAEKEVIICNNVEDMKPKIKLFSRTIELLKKSGISVKIALYGAQNEIDEIGKILNIRIKKIDIDSKFFIVDRKEILFYLSKEQEDENAIWINSEFFTKGFSEIVSLSLRL